MGDKYKIAFIEDDQFLLSIVREKLIRDGYIVVVAADGAEGLALVKKEKPHLVLLDLLLPGMDGFDVLERLKQDGYFKSVPVIVLSNLDQKEDHERATSLGAARYLVKVNVTPAEIVKAVNDMIAEKYL